VAGCGSKFGFCYHIFVTFLILWCYLKKNIYLSLTEIISDPKIPVTDILRLGFLGRRDWFGALGSYSYPLFNRFSYEIYRVEMGPIKLLCNGLNL